MDTNETQESAVARKPYVKPQIEKKRSVSRVTLISGTQNFTATPTTPPPSAGT